MNVAVGVRGLASSDMEGLIRPGVAVVVDDREGAVDGQIAALGDVPVAARDVEGGDVVGAVDGHGDGLRRPCIVLVAQVDGEGFVNGVAFGELIKGGVGLAVELEADVFAFALHGVGVGAIGVDRQAAVLAARNHGRGRAARGGGVGRVEYGRIERLGVLARGSAEIQDMPSVDVIAAGGSGVGGMAREGGVFLAGISGGGVGVFTAHAVLDHMEVAVAAEQIVEIVVGQIKRGDVVGAVDGDGDGLGLAPAGLGVGDVDGEGFGHGLAEGEVVDGIAVRTCFAGVLVVERILVGAVRVEGQGAVGGGVGIDDVPGTGVSGSGHSGRGAAVGQARSGVLDVEVELVDIVIRGTRPVFLVGIGSEDLAGKGSGLMLAFARSAGRRGRVAVAAFRGLVDALFLEVEMEVALIGVDHRDVVGAGDGNGDGLGGGRAVFVGNGHFKGFDLGFPGIELLDLVAGVVERIGPLPGGGIKGQCAVVRGERGVRAACGGVGTVGRAGAVGGGRVAAAFDVERLVLPAVAVRVLHRECAAHGGCVFVDALRGVGDGEFGPVVGAGDGDGDFLRGEAAASVAHIDDEGFGTGFAKSEAVGIGISVVDGIGVGPVGGHCHHAIGGDDAGHLRPVRADEAEGKRIAVGVGAGGPAGHGGDALVEFIAAGEHAGFDDAERAADAEGRRVVGGIVAAQAAPRVALGEEGAVAAQVEPVKAVYTVDEGVVGIFAEASAVRAGGVCRRTGCGHEVWFVQGREELLARDRSAFDHEVGHGVLGIGRIEITQDNGAAVVETENKVIAGTFQRCLISREVEVDSAVPGRFEDGLSARFRLIENDVRHIRTP